MYNINIVKETYIHQIKKWKDKGKKEEREMRKK